MLTDDVKSTCHPELADLRTVERSENRIASRLSLLEQSSLGETLRAWSKSKTDSGSVQRGIHSTLVLRLALNATARACGQKRGFARRALDSTQGKPCSVALLGLAFTMAEILLSLTIIGVVAAITLPSLTGNINERTWNTQRKALYARFSQAIALMPALNGYGTLKEESSSGAGDAVDTAAETFITSGLAKVLKINNICDAEHLADCGIASKIISLNGSTISPVPKTLVALNGMFNSTYSGGGNVWTVSQIDTKAAAFETANGESIIVYYRPNCTVSKNETAWHLVQYKLCANFVYDLNGSKGPNTVGKDIGIISALYSTDSKVVAPLPMPREAGYSTHSVAGSLCRTQDSEARLPNRDELSSIFYNKLLLDIPATVYWSSSFVDENGAWVQDTGSGYQMPQGRKNDSRHVWCVRR